MCERLKGRGALAWRWGVHLTRGKGVSCWSGRHWRACCSLLVAVCVSGRHVSSALTCTSRTHTTCLLQIVIKSQILAGGRGLGKFTNGLQGGVHIIHKSKVKEFASKMLGGSMHTTLHAVGGLPAEGKRKARVFVSSDDLSEAEASCECS